MIKKIALAVVVVLFQACGTIEHHPQMFELAESKIGSFKVNGNVNINNIQESADPVIIHSYGGTSYQSNYQTITHTMVAQAISELARHGEKIGDSEKKTIGLKVTYLNSKYIAFYWKGIMTFMVNLGDLEPFEITINHGTGMSAAQDLSGSIADGVVALFKDDRVISYLAR